MEIHSNIWICHPGAQDGPGTCCCGVLLWFLAGTSSLFGTEEVSPQYIWSSVQDLANLSEKNMERLNGHGRATDPMVTCRAAESMAPRTPHARPLCPWETRSTNGHRSARRTRNLGSAKTRVVLLDVEEGSWLQDPMGVGVPDSNKYIMIIIYRFSCSCFQSQGLVNGTKPNSNITTLHEYQNWVHWPKSAYRELQRCSDQTMMC